MYMCLWGKAAQIWKSNYYSFLLSGFRSRWLGRTSPKRSTSSGFSMSLTHRETPMSTRSLKKWSTTIFPGSLGASDSSSRWSTPYWRRLSWGRTCNRSKVNTQLKLHPLKAWRVWLHTVEVVVAVVRRRIRHRRVKVWNYCCVLYTGKCSLPAG